MKNKGHIFLNLEGNPTHPKRCCLITGHGYYGYVSTTDTFIHTLFKDISMWHGATDTYETTQGNFYNQYELDCRDKPFFKSDSFKKICQIHDIELTIYDDEDDNDIIIEFWEQMKNR